MKIETAYESLVRWIKKQSVGKRKNEFGVELYVMKNAASFLQEHGLKVVLKSQREELK